VSVLFLIFSVQFGRHIDRCFVRTPTLKNVLHEFQFMISRQVIYSVPYIFNFKSSAYVNIIVLGCIAILYVLHR